jgi:hypothetical protein
MRSRALFADTDVRKWEVHVAGGVDGPQATEAMPGRRQWKRLRMSEEGLVGTWKRSPRVQSVM